MTEPLHIAYKAYVRLLLFLSLLLSLSQPGLCQQVVEHGGRKIVSFSLPGLEFQRQKSGRISRSYFSKELEQGKLKVTVRTKGWMGGDLQAERAYQADRTEARRNPYQRIAKDPSVPGAIRALAFTSESPYKSRNLVVYTAHYRCELIVTASKESVQIIEPSYQELLRSIRVISRNKIGELQIGK